MTIKRNKCNHKGMVSETDGGGGGGAAYMQKQGVRRIRSFKFNYTYIVK